MTDTDDPQHRAYHQPDPDDVEERDLDGNDGTFAVRMPIASTGEVRNEGDEPLTRDEIEGMAQQIEQRSVGVFLDHGSNMDVSGSRYSAVGKVGEWEASEVTERSDTDVVEAEARLMDPETLPAAAGSVREALAAVKSQVERDIALSSSIGWRDDDSMAGGVDLLEASIVGIPADPRTTTQGAAVELARVAQAGRDDVDPEQLVADFRAAVMGPDDSKNETMADTDSSGDDPDDTTDEQDGMGAQEYRESMLELQKTQTEILRDMREDDDDDDDDEDDEDEQSADTGDQNAGEDPDDTQALNVNGNTYTADDIAELREQLQDARDDGAVDTPDEGDDRDADVDRTDTTDELLTPRE
jgi:hypothetical protein